MSVAPRISADDTTVVPPYGCRGQRRCTVINCPAKRSYAGLADRQWLCANRFTVADISVGYALMLAGFLGMEPDFSTVVRGYRERLQRRAAYARALEIEQAAAQQGVSTVPAPQGGG